MEKVRWIVDAEVLAFCKGNTRDDEDDVKKETPMDWTWC